MDEAYEAYEAYEPLLHDAMAADHTLFTREDGVDRAWEIITPSWNGRARSISISRGIGRYGG